MSLDRAELEDDIRGACTRSDYAAAASVALKAYGPEIYGFLVGILRRDEDASEVFSTFTERMWRGLPRFAWECSFRTWAYTIARNAARTYDAETRRRGRKESPLPDGSELSGLAEKIRSATKSYLKTQTKSRIAKLRESLPQADQMLLALRVDRQLSFQDLALVMHDGEAELTAVEVTREASRLRKRFQAVKAKLLELGKREGLLDKDGQRDRSKPG